MFHLIGFVCFFSSANCTTPTLIGNEFDTMAACVAFKKEIDSKVDPVEWLYVKSKCAEDEDVI